jgi:signal transduction histidine kinase
MVGGDEGALAHDGGDRNMQSAVAAPGDGAPPDVRHRAKERECNRRVRGAKRLRGRREHGQVAHLDLLSTLARIAANAVRGNESSPQSRWGELRITLRRPLSDALHDRRLRRLIEVGRSLVSELDLESVLTRVLDEARDITGAGYAALGILNERRDGLERFITRGVDEETHRAIGDLPRGRGVLGVLISDPKPLRLRNVGEHPRSYGFPAAHPPMSSFLGVPILIRAEAYGNLYLTEKPGGEFTESDEEAVVILSDWAAIAIDNARLYQGVEARRDELERAVVSLEATTEIARAIGGETDLGRVLELIAKRGRALVHARSLVILLEDGGELVLSATAGQAVEVPIGRRIPLHAEADELGIDAPASLLVPLAFRGRSLGVLSAFGDEFSRDDERLLQAFAASAATAVHTAKSVEEGRLRQSIEAAEMERRRWARELHDETLQGLAGLQVLLGSGLERDDAELRRAATEVVRHVGEQIDALRNLITDLRPAALDELGLEPALESLVERVARTSGVQVELDVELEQETRLPPDLESALYRLIQEALTNVVKHASAQRALVVVRHRNGCVRAAVSDDGRGFDPGAATAGFGLAGMRERAALARGNLTIDSGAGSGTRIEIELPL